MSLFNRSKSIVTAPGSCESTGGNKVDNKITRGLKRFFDAVGIACLIGSGIWFKHTIVDMVPHTLSQKIQQDTHLFARALGEFESSLQEGKPLRAAYQLSLGYSYSQQEYALSLNKVFAKQGNQEAVEMSAEYIASLKTLRLLLCEQKLDIEKIRMEAQKVFFYRDAMQFYSGGMISDDNPEKYKLSF